MHFTSYISQMNSCLYKAKVMHHRLEPKQHRFHYSIFLFYLDLDEIEGLSRRMRWLGHNRFTLFNFREKDHLQLPAGAPDTTRTTREQLTRYLETQQVTIGSGRIMLLTNLCTLGYQFNPVSFYFCYDEQGLPLCSVVEIGNTFREMKPYFLGKERRSGNGFRSNAPKYFYVSPFIDLDTHFDFDLEIPDEKLQIRIDDYDKEGRRFFISTLSGKRATLSDANLLRYFFSFPLITLKVIGLIHWEALRLWLKKMPYHKKADHKDLQREVYRPYKQN
jgi:uncharacterized protein